MPVLNNYPGWLAELITKEQCGFAVPPENPKAFADALEQVADQSEQLNQMGKMASKWLKNSLTAPFFLKSSLTG